MPFMLDIQARTGIAGRYLVSFLITSFLISSSYFDSQHSVNFGIVVPRAYRLLRRRGHVTASIACVPSKIQIKDKI